MKTRILIFALALTCGVLASCKKEDKTKAPEVVPTSVTGAYSLKNVSGGLLGANVNFTEEEVKWSFDATTDTLWVKNSVDSTDARYSYSYLPSGTYNFEFQTQGTQQLLFIDNTKRGAVTLTANGWTLDEGIAADGLLLTFEK